MVDTYEYVSLVECWRIIIWFYEAMGIPLLPMQPHPNINRGLYDVWLDLSCIVAASQK